MLTSTVPLPQTHSDSLLGTPLNSAVRSSTVRNVPIPSDTSASPLPDSNNLTPLPEDLHSDKEEPAPPVNTDNQGEKTEDTPLVEEHTEEQIDTEEVTEEQHLDTDETHPPESQSELQPSTSPEIPTTTPTDAPTQPTLSEIMLKLTQITERLDSLETKFNRVVEILSEPLLKPQQADF